MFIPELAGYTPTDLATASPEGLALVEERITQVIADLEDQLTELAKVDFPTQGHIAKTSFGGGDRSPLLALHHARAHNVVTTTLDQLKKDLEGFKLAIGEAANLLRETDGAAHDDARAILKATEENLDLGDLHYQEAQVEHRNDVATATPEENGTTDGEDA